MMPALIVPLANPASTTVLPVRRFVVLVNQDFLLKQQGQYTVYRAFPVPSRKIVPSHDCLQKL
jgi:hypothetical protein